jgi:hypothetical protein
VPCYPDYNKFYLGLMPKPAKLRTSRVSHEIGGGLVRI